MKPLLKWPGGKRRIAADILARVSPYMSDNSRYIELFAGGAAVFFHAEPRQAVLVDSCKPLMSFYEAVKRDPTALCDELDRLIALPFCEETYSTIKREWNASDFGIKFSARLLYLNRTGFNGLFRLNASGGYNVAWGKLEKLPGFPSRDDIKQASGLLRRAKLYAGDYGSILRATHRGDVVVCDPPYWGTYDRYNGGHFTDKDQRKLSEMLNSAVARGVSVVASNIDCKEVREMYDSWATIETIPVHHKIGASAEGRSIVQEVIISASGPLVDRRQTEMFGDVK